MKRESVTISALAGCVRFFLPAKFVQISEVKEFIQEIFSLLLQLKTTLSRKCIFGHKSERGRQRVKDPFAKLDIVFEKFTLTTVKYEFESANGP